MGHGQAQRPGGAQIHHEFDGGGQLHRQVPRLLAAQDADDIAGGAAEQVGQIGAVAEQGTGMGKARLVTDHGDALGQGGGGDVLDHRGGQKVAHHHQRLRAFLAQRAHASRQCHRVALRQRQAQHPQPLGAGRGLAQPPPGVEGRVGGIVHHADG